MTDLRKLSEAATPGGWLHDERLIYALDETGNCNRMSLRVDGGYTWWPRRSMTGTRTPDEELDAVRDYVLALVKEHRSGSLIPRSEYERVLALLAEAREALAHISYREIENTRRNPDWPRRIARATLSRIDDALAAEPEARG